MPQDLPSPASLWALLSCAWIVAVAPTAARAQGTIQDRNVRYSVQTMPGPDEDTVDCDFTADAQFAPDVLREQGWFFRYDDEPDETPFHDDGAFLQTYSGARADLGWPDLGGRGRLRARLGIEVISTGPASGVVQSRLTLTNRTSEPVPITIFHYADVDACVAETDVAFGSGPDHTVVGECALQQVRVRGTQLDSWEVQPQSASECGLLDAGRRRLGNRGLPMLRGNHSACFRWKRTVPPDLPIVLIVRIEHNSGPCGAARSVPYGQGTPGLNGVPALSTTGLPRIGGVAELEVTDARGNAPVIWLFGFDRANTVVGNLTFLIQPGPRGLQFDFLAGITDPQGRGSLQVPVPASLSFCAELIYWQAFVIDDSVSGVFPMSHSGGVNWILGR